MEIENKYLKITVKKEGGSLTSIYDKIHSKELLYQPLKDSWQGQDIFIFPFIARLKNQAYTVDNKEYTLKNHGLIRYMTGIDKSTSKEIKVVFESNEETLRHYPFSFVASSSYRLENNTVIVTYKIKNTGDSRMFFMLGGHPAYRLPGVRNDSFFDISGNKIVFPKIEDLLIEKEEDTFSFVTNEEFFAKTGHIDLSKDLFAKINTIIINAKDIKELKLVKKDNSIINITIGNAPYLALWSDMKYGDFVAIEPWFGLPDENNPKKEAKNKKGINFLEPNCEFCYSYYITIE